MNNSLGNKEVMARNILRYMDINDKDRKTVCADLGISYTTFTDWVKGNTYPRIDKIELLANYFGVSKADLVEEYVPEATLWKQRTLSPDEVQLLEDYQKLNAIGQGKVREYASDLTEQDRYKKDTGSLKDIAM